jgi:hypothetical protein
MKRIKLNVLYLLASVVMLNACGVPTYDDYINSAQNTEQQYTEELLSCDYEESKNPNAVLIDELNTDCVMLLSDGSKLNVNILDTKICKSSQEYLSIMSEDEEFMEWMTTNAAKLDNIFDTESNSFTCHVAGVDVWVFLVSMRLYNPDEVPHEIRISSLRLYEYNTDSEGFKFLSMVQDYRDDRSRIYVGDDAAYTLESGETFETTLWCIIPSKRILSYYLRRGSDGSHTVTAGDVEEYDLNSVYLRLSTRGNPQIVNGEQFFKLKCS